MLNIFLLPQIKKKKKNLNELQNILYSFKLLLGNQKSKSLFLQDILVFWPDFINSIVDTEMPRYHQLPTS